MLNDTAVTSNLLKALVEHSRETERFRRSRSTQKAEQVRTLTDSKCNIYWKSEGLLELCSDRTWYKFCASQRRFVKGAKRVDICGCCYAYNKLILPEIRRCIFGPVACAFQEIPGCEHYWQDFNVAEDGPEFASVGHLEALVARLEDPKQDFKQKLPLGSRLLLHEAEAKWAHNLRQHLCAAQCFRHHRQ